MAFHILFSYSKHGLKFFHLEKTPGGDFGKKARRYYLSYNETTRKEIMSQKVPVGIHVPNKFVAITVIGLLLTGFGASGILKKTWVSIPKK